MARRIVLVGMVLSLILVGCSDTGSSDGTGAGGNTGGFTYDGTAYVTDRLFLDNLGANTDTGESGFDVDAYITESTVEVQSDWLTGVADLVYLDFNSDTDGQVSPGTYTLSGDPRAPGVLSDAAVAFDYDYDTDTGTIIDAVSGTAAVTFDGTTYTIEYTLTLTDGESVDGSFSGPAEEVL